MSGVVKYYYHSATSNPRTTMHAALACVGQTLLRLYPTVYTSEDRLVYKLRDARIMTYYHLKWDVEFATEEQAVAAAKTAFSHDAERAKRKQAERADCDETSI